MKIYDNICKNMQKHENIFEGVRGVNLKNLLKTLGHHFDLTYKNEVDIKKTTADYIYIRLDPHVQDWMTDQCKNLPRQRSQSFVMACWLKSSKKLWGDACTPWKLKSNCLSTFLAPRKILFIQTTLICVLGLKRELGMSSERERSWGDLWIYWQQMWLCGVDQLEERRVYGKRKKKSSTC